MVPFKLIQTWCAVSILFVTCIQFRQTVSLDCYRCIHSTCEEEIGNSKICTTVSYEITKDFNLVAESGPPQKCPGNYNSGHSHSNKVPDAAIVVGNESMISYQETCTDPKAFCGRRFLKVNLKKFTERESSSGSNFTSGSTTTSTTAFPILKPEGIWEHEFDYVVYSCTSPQKDCSSQYSIPKNITLDLDDGRSQNSVLQVTTTFTPNSYAECAQCKINLCNNMGISIPGFSPGSDSGSVNAAALNTFEITFIFTATLFSFLI